MDKQKLIIIVVAFLLFLCALLIIILVFDSPKAEVETVTYTLDFPLMLPIEPGYTGEYLYAHTPRDRWTLEEVNEWFVVPTDENLERLSSANDQVVKKILEAAP